LHFFDATGIIHGTHMRKIVVTEFVSLDGVVEAPNEWSSPFWNDEIAKYKLDELFASDALLLGRVTYQGFAAAWPGRTDAEGFADRMNSLPKFVVSTTLKAAEWNNSTLIKRNVLEEVARLKRQPGLDILIGGSGELVDTLRLNDLIDEYRLLIYPVVVGRGSRLFKEGSNATLRLVDNKALGSGVVALWYAPAVRRDAE
jgi:dihydrofolate reductase